MENTCIREAGTLKLHLYPGELVLENYTPVSGEMELGNFTYISGAGIGNDTRIPGSLNSVTIPVSGELELENYTCIRELELGIIQVAGELVVSWYLGKI
jgi:hypothetical protein